jgi:hypothetical protein
VLVTIVTSAQFRKVSGRPHPSPSVPLVHTPHMFPGRQNHDMQMMIIQVHNNSSIAHSSGCTVCTSWEIVPSRMLTSVVSPLYYTLRACDVGRQADFVPEDSLFLGLEGNMEGHVFCT